MTRPQAITLIGLTAFIGTILLLGSIYLGSGKNAMAKNAPQDPGVKERLDEARSLQRQGALEEAFTIFEKHALQGFPEAMFYTAKAYSKGWGVAPDLDKARHFWLSAVPFGFSYRGETAFELGRLFQRSHGVDCNTIAVEWFEKALDWHYEKAALQLAIHYEKGLGVDQNMATASYYYERAIEAGNEQAHIKYARLLIDGKHGLQADPDRALSLVGQAIIQLDRKAAAGSASAAKQLGRLFLEGKLVPRNLESAEKRLRRATYLGSQGGMHELANLLMLEPSNREEQQEALSWLRRAAEKGHGGAITALGRYHLKGKFGLDKPSAVRWFELGVAAGHGGSMEELARLYWDGVLVDRDLEEALRFAEMGSRKGHSGSKSLLKDMQSEGTEKAQLSTLIPQRQE